MALNRRAPDDSFKTCNEWHYEEAAPLLEALEVRLSNARAISGDGDE